MSLAAISRSIALRLLLRRLRRAVFFRPPKSADCHRRVVVMLAQRLRPTERLDFEQAITELERAVEVAHDVIARGKQGSSDDATVNVVLARVADRIRSDDLDGGANAIDVALIELEAGYKQSQVALLEEGVKVNSLRRDAASVARRIETIVAVGQSTDRPAWLTEFRSRISELQTDGEVKGVNFSLSVAVELACRMVATAREADERGCALNLLGKALSTLGTRESGLVRLEHAVSAYRAALEEMTRDRAPLDWAEIQHELGDALFKLHDRRTTDVFFTDKATYLEEAIAAYCSALEERTPEQTPFQWAETQARLRVACGVLLQLISFTRTSNNFPRMTDPEQPGSVCTMDVVSDQLGQTEGNVLAEATTPYSATSNIWEGAIAAYSAILEDPRRIHIPLERARMQSKLGNVLEEFGDHAGAVEAWRTALKDLTQRREPFLWAGVYYSIANSLRQLGGISRLEEAIAAYNMTLKVWTRDTQPLWWAYTQIGLAQAIAMLATLQNKVRPMEEALTRLRNARELFEEMKDARWQKLAHREYLALEAKLAQLHSTTH